MAKDTRDKIRRAALSLFSTRWFETVSIAEICREAGVSNGVFYRYFGDKKALVLDLLDEFLVQFGTELLSAGGSSVRERLERLIAVIFGSAMEHAAQVTVFREGQYRFPEYERKLREIYVKCCENVLGRPVSEAEYLYMISGIRFCSTRALYDGLPRAAGTLAGLVLSGVFPDSAEPASLGIPPEFPEITEPEPGDSRERLLLSGMRLIGARGYHGIGVSDIARECDLSVGTFYTYFGSKEEFFSLIVERIGHQTRHYLSGRAKLHRSRLEQEVYGVWHFLSYFNGRKEYYSIVREAEFVAKPWVKRYYDAFEAGYMHNLTSYDGETRRVAANFLMGPSHYVGIEALLNGRVGDVPAFIGELARLLKQGVKP